MLVSSLCSCVLLLFLVVTNLGNLLAEFFCTPNFARILVTVHTQRDFADSQNKLYCVISKPHMINDGWKGQHLYIRATLRPGNT